MEITYKNKFTDLLSFTVYTLSRLWIMQVLVALFLIVIAYADLPSLRESNDAAPFKVMILAAHILKWFVGWVVVMLIVLVLLYLPKRDKTFLTEHKIVLSDTGFMEQTAYNRTEASWSGIYKVCESRRFIFIYVSRLAAHVIPKRVFPSQEDSQNYFQYASKQWQK